MARVKAKTRMDPWHRFGLVSDGKSGELLLVTGGRNAYLWAGRTDGLPGCVTFSGPSGLRKLAYAILKEVGK